ncbi:N/A [soil metagenome]
MRQGRRGFTLIEALVAAVLLAVGVSAVMVALGRQVRTEANVRRREVLSGLAQAKLDELSATSTTQTDSDGDFSDEGYPDVTWKSTTEDTGVADLQALTLSLTDKGASAAAIKATTLIYTQPTSTTTEATP